MARKRRRSTRALARRSRSRALGAALPNCPRPAYSAVLTGDVVGGLVQVACVAGGAFAGWMIGGGRNNPNAPMTTLIGAAGGMVLGSYPSMLAQRAATRSDGCTQPGMGRLFGYWAAKATAAGVVGVATKQLAPDNKLVPSVVGAAAFFGAPVLGQAILRT